MALTIIDRNWKKNGMVLSGLSPDKRIVEMFEIQPGHPFFDGNPGHL